MAHKKIVFARHGKAPQLAEDQKCGVFRADDLARMLGEVGMAQATARREMLGLNFDRVFASPASRAIDSAAILSGFYGDEVVPVSAFYTPDGPDGDLLEKLFELLPTDPVRAYLAHPLNDDNVVQRFCQNAAAVILDYLAENEDDETALMVGHNVLTQMAVLGLLKTDPSRIPKSGFSTSIWSRPAS